VHFEYALPSPGSDIRVRVNVGPEVGARIKLRLDYLPADEPPHTYEIAGNSGWIPLEPHWYEAAWLLARTGFTAAFAIDRFVFLLCLVAPFRAWRGVLTLSVVVAASEAVTLTAVAQGALADLEVGWLPLFANAVLAAAMVLLAIGNLGAPSLRRRWLVGAIIGSIVGFGLGRLLTAATQFAGTHTTIAAIAFDIGLGVGVVASGAIAFVALRLLFARVLGPLLGVIVLSALVAHAAWHGMMDNGSDLLQQIGRVPVASLWPALGTVALWLVPAAVIGVVATVFLRRWDGMRRPTLLAALQKQGGERATRP
jgi:hypothetical protein